MVAHECLWCSIEVDIAMQTAHMEHILAFEIRRIAPTEHLDANIVLSCAHVVADIKLMVVVTTLSITYILAIDPNKGT